MNLFSYLKNDIKSSIVVFLVALPLCLGISLASGAPLLSGIIAGIVGGIIVGLVSDSKTSVSGPAAGLTVIVLSAITTLGDFYVFTFAVFLAGLLQISMGILKAGQIGAYFPNSVIKGMLSAIGIILILKQIPHAVGFDSDFMGDESFFQLDGENTFSEILMALQSFQLGSIVISLFSLISLIIWERLSKKNLSFFKSIPGPLFVVIASVLINKFIFMNFDFISILPEHLVSLPVEGGFSSFFNSLQMPNWSQYNNLEIYKIAATLAIVASLETLLGIEAVDKIDPHKNVTNKNRELIAQGLGNSFSGLIGGLPLTSVIVRSTANVSSGSRTQLSTILHGLWIIIAVVLLPHYLQLIPLATLASILILVGYKLCNPAIFIYMKKQGRNQIIPFVTTIVAILFTDLLVGISIGLITGIYFVLKSNSHKSIVLVHDEKDYLIRFTKDVSFFSKPHMLQLLNSIPHGSKVVIDGSNHLHIDNDIISIIEDFIEVSSERNITHEIIKSSLAINPFFKES